MIGTGSPLTFRTGEALAESLRASRSVKGKGRLTELSIAEPKSLRAGIRRADGGGLAVEFPGVRRALHAKPIRDGFRVAHPDQAS